MGAIDFRQFVSMQTSAAPSIVHGREVVSSLMNPGVESLSKRLLVKVAALIQTIVIGSRPCVESLPPLPSEMLHHS
jgi:hypothetical protein